MMTKNDFEKLETGCITACDSIMEDLRALFEISQSMIQHDDIDPYYRHELNVLVGASFALIHAINITFPGGTENDNEGQTCSNSKTAPHC
jgi:hypothetical protein